jgi:hypothetical protein
MAKNRIEDLEPHFKTVLQALRYGLEILDNPTFGDKEKISRARHQIRDAMHILGYTDHLAKTYRKP